MDNQKGTVPSGWVLTELKNFIKVIEKYGDVEVVIFANNSFKTLDIEQGIIVETIDTKKVDICIISMTKPAVHNLLSKKKVRSEFFNVLGKLKENKPLIFCAGVEPVDSMNSSGYLNDFNVTYQRKIGIKWFNLHLKNTVSKILTNLRETKKTN